MKKLNSPSLNIFVVKLKVKAKTTKGSVDLIFNLTQKHENIQRT